MALRGVLAKAMADRKCTGEQGRPLLRSATLLLATLAATPELHGTFLAPADSRDVVATVVGLLRNCAQARSAAAAGSSSADQTPTGGASASAPSSPTPPATGSRLALKAAASCAAFWVAYSTRA